MEFEGDFLGFSIDSYHSKDLGMVRTSKGMSTDSLIPSLQDVAVTIPKGDGSLYYGSTYTQRQFTVNIAFENVTDDTISLWKTIFNKKTIQKLIFDEAPYKSYNVKTTGLSTIKHLAFTKNNVRYYSGEGILSFTCYFPYAISEFYELDSASESAPAWAKSDADWAAASNIPKVGDGVRLDVTSSDPDTFNENGCLYNAGDDDLLLFMYILHPGSDSANDKLNINFKFILEDGAVVEFGLDQVPWDLESFIDYGICVDFFRGEIYSIDSGYKSTKKSYLTYMTGKYVYIPKHEKCHYSIESNDPRVKIEFRPNYLYL